jgi:hypothetical protein
MNPAPERAATGNGQVMRDGVGETCATEETQPWH